MTNYKISNREMVFKKLLEANRVVTSSSGYFGAEINEHFDAFARVVDFGSNLGQVVVKDESKFIIRRVPAGIFSGKPTIIGENCVIDPYELAGEIGELREKGVDLSNLTIGNFNVITPFDKVLDLINDPTGQTTTATRQSMLNHRALKLEDFINCDERLIHMNLNDSLEIMHAKGYDFDRILEEVVSNPNVSKELLSFLETGEENMTDFYVHSMEDLLKEFPEVSDTRSQLSDLILKNKAKILLEGNHYRSLNLKDKHSSQIIMGSGISPSLFSSSHINIIDTTPSRLGGGLYTGYVDQDWFHKYGITSEDIESLGINHVQVNGQAIEAIDNGVSKANKVYFRPFNSPKFGISLGEKALTLAEILAIDSATKQSLEGGVSGPMNLCAIVEEARVNGGKVVLSYLPPEDIDRFPMIIGLEYKAGDERISNGIKYSPGERISIDKSLPDKRVLCESSPVYSVVEKGKNENSSELNSEFAKLINLIEEKANCRVVYTGNEYIRRADILTQ